MYTMQKLLHNQNHHPTMWTRLFTSNPTIDSNARAGEQIARRFKTLKLEPTTPGSLYVDFKLKDREHSHTLSLV